MGRLNMNVERPFGLSLSTESARGIACSAIQRPVATGVSLVVTPNIDHIAMIRRSPALAQAYANATHIVCDGWPVQLYARFCGLPVARVTGCEITSELMRMAPYPDWQRLFFVVDSQETKLAVEAWAARNGVTSSATIPPFGFERDASYCARLAAYIRGHGTTLLVMAVGAPRSEVFIDTHRTMLPPCWAFCVGQAVKVELGLVQRASPRWQALGLEWLWRIFQEPSRLAKRYATATIGFGCAIVEDQLRVLRESRS